MGDHQACGAPGTEVCSLATLVTLALRYAAGQIGRGVLPALALTRGYAVSFRVGAAVLAVAGLLTLVLLERVTATPRTALAEVAADQDPHPAATR